MKKEKSVASFPYISLGKGNILNQGFNVWTGWLHLHINVKEKIFKLLSVGGEIGKASSIRTTMRLNEWIRFYGFPAGFFFFLCSGLHFRNIWEICDGPTNHQSVHRSVSPWSVSHFFQIEEIAWKRQRITGKWNLANLSLQFYLCPFL